MHNVLGQERVSLQAATALSFAVLAVSGSCVWAFPAPIQADPASTAVNIPVDYSQTLSYSETLNFSTSNPTATYPDVYWFKYTSNGQSVVKFDTLGSNFGTNGPGNPSGGGSVLGSYNQSQIAVYKADGSLQAISKNTVDLQGNPIPIYPNYASSDPKSQLWYTPQGLSELYFQPNAPTDPHWSVSPTDPTPYTGWSAPGNEGNGQTYYPPSYYTSLNEYQVWNTALSPVVLDNNGNPVIDPSTGKPYQQPGWRYYDRARVGPGSTWNRYDVLPAGVYYIAVASSGPVLAHDKYSEEILQAPVNYDYSTGTANQPAITGPLGNFQYYLDSSTPSAFGTIQLNVTQTPIPEPASIVDSASLLGLLLRRRRQI